MRPASMGFLFCFLLTLLVASYGLPSSAATFPGSDHEPAGSTVFCPVGQVWPGYDEDWIEPGTINGGGETFFALFDPGENCPCPLGFEVTTSTFYMTIAGDTPLPITITISLGMKEAVSTQNDQFPWLPGATVCETPARDVTIKIPKEFIGWGSALDCDCVSMDRPFFLFFTIHSDLEPPGGFYTAGGGSPELGRFLTFVDGHWVDLVAEGILTRGDLVISGSALCCENPVAVDDQDELLPTMTRMIGIYPNPFNPHTTIAFSVARSQHVSISVFDMTGRRVTEIADRVYETGAHTVEWDGKDAMDRDVPSGSYLIRLESATAVQSQKVQLLR